MTDTTLNTTDLERETDLQVSRILREDVLSDEAVLTHVREKVEASRVYNEAYGSRMSTEDYVTLTLQFLADELAVRP